MKKAVIAVAAVLVFIFTLTQKSEAVPANTWDTLDALLRNSTDYSIELTGDITSNTSFALFTLTADKKITSTSGNSLFFIFSPPPKHNQVFWL